MDCLDSLCVLRASRTKDAYVFDRAYTPPSKVDSEDWWLDQGSGIQMESNEYIVTDQDGVPILIEPTYNQRLTIPKMEEFRDRLLGNGCDRAIMVMESDSGTAENLMSFIGFDFAIPALKKTPFVKNMMSQIVKKKTDQKAQRNFEDRSFVAYDTDVAIVPRKVQRRIDSREEDNESPDYEMVISNDSRFFTVDQEDRLSAWACLEVGQGSDDSRERMSRKLADIESQLRMMDPYDALDRVRDVAGEFSRYLDVRVVEGELEVKVRQKGVSAALNREGIFVVLSHGLRNWGDMMSCIRCRSIYQHEVMVMRTNLISTRADGRQVPMMVSTTVQFVALILWSTCNKRLGEAGIEMPVSTVMQILDTMMAIGNGSTWSITEPNSRHRKMFEALRVPVPKESIPSSCYEYVPGKRSTERSERSRVEPERQS